MTPEAKNLKIAVRAFLANLGPQITDSSLFIVLDDEARKLGFEMVPELRSVRGSIPSISMSFKRKEPSQ